MCGTATHPTPAGAATSEAGSAPRGGTHRADREPLLRAAGENSTGEAPAATTGRPFLPPGRESGLGAALPRVLRADPGVRGEAGVDGNMAVRAGAAPRSRPARAERVTAGRGRAGTERDRQQPNGAERDREEPNAPGGGEPRGAERGAAPAGERRKPRGGHSSRAPYPPSGGEWRPGPPLSAARPQGVNGDPGRPSALPALRGRMAARAVLRRCPPSEGEWRPGPPLGAARPQRVNGGPGRPSALPALRG
ncbi:collagen alpha-1(II) chain-like [Passer montanus]|uniref:collagen alpha-1(II) chain-like n=1 Tax=Passer montanus TaxID=9160 RepID=UPI00195F8C5A|nr:collagen alpha-1(II) chain-like [Passer montanus]